MKTRVQRFNVGDTVSILDGLQLKIMEVFLDPHPMEFSHCSGNSARYICSSPFGPQTRYDWELSLVRKSEEV